MLHSFSPETESSSFILLRLKDLKNRVKEGWMTKQGSFFKTWKERYFVLSPQALYYFSNDKGDAQNLGYFQLADTFSTEVSRADLECMRTPSMKICSGKRTLYAYTETYSELKSWMSSIDRVLKDELASFKKPKDQPPKKETLKARLKFLCDILQQAQTSLESYMSTINIQSSINAGTDVEGQFSNSYRKDKKFQELVDDIRNKVDELTSELDKYAEDFQMLDEKQKRLILLVKEMLAKHDSICNSTTFIDYNSGNKSNNDINNNNNNKNMGKSKITTEESSPITNNSGGNQGTSNIVSTPSKEVVLATTNNSQGNNSSPDSSDDMIQSTTAILGKIIQKDKLFLFQPNSEGQSRKVDATVTSRKSNVIILSSSASLSHSPTNGGDTNKQPSGIMNTMASSEDITEIEKEDSKKAELELSKKIAEKENKRRTMSMAIISQQNPIKMNFGLR